MESNIQGKTALRRALRACLAMVTPSEREAWSAAATKSLLAMNEVIGRDRWMAFASMPGEIDTRPLIRALLSADRIVAVPRIDGATGQMSAYRIHDLDGLVTNRWGIPEPPADPRQLIEPSQFDVIVVPGLGFDAAGGRLGRAGGYYDKFLRAAGHGALRIGFFYACQQIPSIPQEEWDEHLDFVATEAEVIRCTGPSME